MRGQQAGKLLMKSQNPSAPTQAQPSTKRVQTYVEELSTKSRSRLLAEMERLKLCGDDTPGFDAILTALRAEFRRTGQNARAANPSPYFFQPAEPLLVDRAPENINAGLISRGSLSPIWDWISLNLLPTMASEYSENMKRMIAANNPHEIAKIAAAFQTKVVKYLEGTLAAQGGVERVRNGLAMYTSSKAVFDDLTKIVGVLRARDALVELNAELPPKISQLEGAALTKVHRLLQAFAAKHADELPFAIATVANHLKAPWQVINLVGKPAKGRNAADAAMPYISAVAVLLDQIEEKRVMLRGILKNKRVTVAKEILAQVDEIERALMARTDLLAQSDYKPRLDRLLAAVEALVAAEVNSLPGNLQHVLGTRGSRGHDSLTERLSSLASKGRDALSKLMT